LKPIINQGVQGFIGDDENTATIATIATIRPTTRNLLFPAKAQASVTAFTRFHNDVTFVNKFHSCSVQSGLRDKGSTP